MKQTWLCRIKNYRHIVLLLLLCGMFFGIKKMSKEVPVSALMEKDEGKRTVIVLDPGHGGADPGKVGVSGRIEKEINLSVAKKVENRLTAAGFTVIMTRETDDGLYSPDARNRKREDMEARVRLIANSQPALVVSIHQNSFSDESCRGAQVFYFEGAKESKRLAESVQQAFSEILQDGNRRQAKGNTTYYMLKKTECPIVIAECGFLSNPEEEELLSTDLYQEKVAEAIYLGLTRYLEMTGEPDC